MEAFNNKFKQAILEKIPEWEGKYHEKQRAIDKDNESPSAISFFYNNMMLD
jgi:hypothetical protein